MKLFVDIKMKVFFVVLIPLDRFIRNSFYKMFSDTANVFGG